MCCVGKDQRVCVISTSKGCLGCEVLLSLSFPQLCSLFRNLVTAYFALKLNYLALSFNKANVHIVQAYHLYHIAVCYVWGMFANFCFIFFVLLFHGMNFLSINVIVS
jgi:hypothetical protein